MRLKMIWFLLLPFFLWSVPYSPTRAPWPPFVSGDGFRAYCDYVFDETDTSLDPRTVKPHSTIFVKGDYLGRFFSQIHPRLPYPYVLVAHNSDEALPGPFSSFLQDDKLLAWFAQNMDDASHPKMHPIPIGIANRYWGHGNGSLIARTQAKHLTKSYLLYLNIAVGTYPQERRLVADLFSRAPFAYRASNQPFEAFLNDVASCKFVASPRGNGLDTHRLWESLYLGSYPIVKTSTLDSLYADLPVLIIQDWHQVTEEFLNQKYQEFNNTSFNLEKLDISYWTKLIDSYR